jgi:hypothetical protein
MKHLFYGGVVLALFLLVNTYSMDDSSSDDESCVTRMLHTRESAIAAYVPVCLPKELLYIINLYAGSMPKPVGRDKWQLLCKEFNELFSENNKGYINFLQVHYPEFNTDKTQSEYYQAIYTNDLKKLHEIHATNKDIFVRNFAGDDVGMLGNLYQVPQELQRILTPLFFATYHRNLRECTFLLNRDNLMYSLPQLLPLFRRHDCNFAERADEDKINKDKKLLRLLAQRGFDFNLSIPYLGFPLQQLIKDNNIPSIEFLLEKQLIDINCLLGDPDKKARILFEPRGPNSKKAPIILGGSLDYMPPQLIRVQTPLNYALTCVGNEQGSGLELVRILLRHGASPWQTDRYHREFGHLHSYGQLKLLSLGEERKSEIYALLMEHDTSLVATVIKTSTALMDTCTIQ